MNTWFTSDWHIGHKNILKYDNRPFENVFFMNQEIIKNFNKLVNENDDVYYLGDFAFNSEQGIDALNHLKGRWHFIIGNHDRSLSKIVNLSRKEIFGIDKIREVKVDKQEITLCHYPMVSWNKSHYGTWQLFGHHHQKTYEEIKGKRLNVTINMHDYKPWSFDEVAEYMKTREIEIGRDE